MPKTVGLILAAGRGSRMGDATDKEPKCLARLGGHSLLEWQIGALRKAGITTIYAVGGYRWEKLTNYVDVKFVNKDWETTNMVWSLRQAAEILENNPCIISYSDIVYHPDILRSLIKCTDKLAISYDLEWRKLWSQRFEYPIDDIESFKISGNQITQIGHPVVSLDEVEGQFMGLIQSTPDIWLEIEKILSEIGEENCRQLDVTSLLQLIIQHGHNLTGVPTNGRWCEVDSKLDWTLYNDWCLSNNHHIHDWRW